MNWLTDEMLYYAGMIVAGCTLLIGMIYLGISQIKMVRLNARLDAEYGEKKKK